MSLGVDGRHEPVGNVTGEDLLARQPAAASAVIEFVTPTDLRAKDERTPGVDGVVLVKRILRRLGDLLELYEGWSPREFPFAPLVAAAETLRCQPLGLEVRELSRTSQSRGGTQKFAGMVGLVAVSGIAESGWP